MTLRASMACSLLCLTLMGSMLPSTLAQKPAHKMGDKMGDKMAHKTVYVCKECKMYFSPTAAKKMSYKDPMGHKLVKMASVPAGYTMGGKMGKMDHGKMGHDKMDKMGHDKMKGGKM